MPAPPAGKPRSSSPAMARRFESAAWYQARYGEDMYRYHENRFFPLVAECLSRISGRILDAACGDGNPYLQRIIPDPSRLVGLDLDPDVRRRNALHRNFIIGDILELRGGGDFDAVFSLYTWEHLASPRKALAAFHSFLKPGGFLILIAPQGWNSISVLERLLPGSVKRLAWRRIKDRGDMPYPAYYRSSTRQTLCREAERQNFRMLRYTALEGPPLWFATRPVLFKLLCRVQNVLNAVPAFSPFRSTFLAVLEKTC